MYATARRATAVGAVTAAASGLLFAGSAVPASADDGYHDDVEVTVVTDADGAGYRDRFRYAVSSGYSRDYFSHYGDHDSSYFDVRADRWYRVYLRSYDRDCEFDDIDVDGLDRYDYRVYGSTVRFRADAYDEDVTITYSYSCDEYDDDYYRAAQS